MKRNHIVDLTSLLDIILILLFAFMINMADSVREQEETTAASQEASQSLQSALEKQKTLVEELESAQEALKQQLEEGEVQIDELYSKNDQEAQAIKTLMKTLSEWMGTNEPLVSEIVGEDAAQQLIDPKILNETLQKYEAISKNYVFIDVVLQTKDSHIFINGEATSIYILEQELISLDLKSSKQSEIVDLFVDYLDNFKGGYSFALITLAEDGQVKRAQYNLVWEAIKEVQQKKNSEKVFLTQIQGLRP